VSQKGEQIVPQAEGDRCDHKAIPKPQQRLASLSEIETV
jgi:hypothetical protein